MEPTTIGVLSSTLCWEWTIVFLTDFEIWSWLVIILITSWSMIIFTPSFQQTTRGHRAAGLSCRLCVDLHYSLLCHQVVQASVFILVLTTCICSQGTNIKLAQHIFSALYLINLALVFRIMVKTRKVCQTSNFICLRMKFGYNRFAPLGTMCPLNQPVVSIL